MTTHAAILPGPMCPAAEMKRQRSRRRAIPRGPALAIVLAAFLVAAPNHGRAQETPSVWAYSFYKTLTYEALANGFDLILYATVLGGTAAASLPFLAVNALSAASVYYAHEVTWNLLGPVPQTTAGTVELGLTKTLTYRVLGTAQHLAVAYAFTGNLWASVGYAAAVNATDTVVYIANEYGWDVYGPPLPIAATEGRVPPGASTMP